MHLLCARFQQCLHVLPTQSSFESFVFVCFGTWSSCLPIPARNAEVERALLHLWLPRTLDMQESFLWDTTGWKLSGTPLFYICNIWINKWLRAASDTGYAIASCGAHKL